MLRTEVVELMDIIIPREYAYSVIQKMGNLGYLHMIDLEANIQTLQKPYYQQLRRCEQLQGQINEIEAQLGFLGVKISRCPNYNAYLERVEQTLIERKKHPQTYLDDLEQDITHRYDFFMKQQSNMQQLLDKRNTLYEQKALMILSKDIIFKDYMFSSRISDQHISLRLRSQSESNLHSSLQIYQKKKIQADYKLKCLAGSILSQDVNMFYRLLFRASKGNVWFHSEMINDQYLKIRDYEDEDGVKKTHVPQGVIDSRTLRPLQKSTFVIFFQTGLHDVMLKKFQRICDGFNVTFYQLPDDANQFESIFSRLQQQLDEVEDLVQLTYQELQNYANYFTGIHSDNELEYDEIFHYGWASYLEEVKLYVQREKSIYFHLNYLRISENYCEGTFWCPQSKLNILQDQLYAVCSLIHMQSNPQQKQNSKFEPPSYIKTNDVQKKNLFNKQFTFAFQELVNTYGNPRVGEINPGIFTIVTFPFLFGVMFGDIGHGSLLLCFGIYLVFYGEQMLRSTKKTYRSDPVECRDVEYLYKARYMLMMMGVFSVFCGFIYNDFFSISLDYANTCFNEGKQIDGCTPFFGMDGAWGSAQNKLSIMNSFKMKLSIVIGVTHMVFGILLKGVNNIQSRSAMDFFCEFIPQICFMLATFGYMTFLILIKWNTDFSDKTAQAPSIITVLLTMYFKLGDVDGYVMYPNQARIQFYLIIISVIAVPWMLYIKPFIRSRQHNHVVVHNGEHIQLIEENQDEQQIEMVDLPQKPQKQTVAQLDFATDNNVPGSLRVSRKIVEQKNHGLDEIIIEQCIETIEFVLGSVSNTASYLRLWALSLAHSQLSEVVNLQKIVSLKVFFEKTLGMGLHTGEIPSLIFLYLVFITVTFMVLMCMDSLECFLHALRLHWVEFQNKFFKADGYAFVAFSFRENMENNKDFSTRI